MVSLELKSKFFKLILQHYIVAECNQDVSQLKVLSLPYGIRTRDHNIQFDIDRIPVQLQNILYRFLRITTDGS